MPGDAGIFWFLKNLVYKQFVDTWYLPIPSKDYSGKTVIVTGSNVGLGLEAARHCARLNAAKIIIAVRTISKGEAAKASIESSTKCGPSVIEVWQLDLQSYDSVKSFAARATKELGRLDVLLENAAIATDQYRVAEGLESTLTTNVMSTFLLAFLLLPKLKETATKHNVRANLTIVSSGVHYMLDFTERDLPEETMWADLNDKSKANMDERYSLSKLLEVYVVREMAKRSGENYPVTINMVDPGLCHSELARESGWGLYFMKLLLARTSEQGSRTLMHAVEGGPETHGEFESSCNIVQTATVVSGEGGEKTQEKIWRVVMAELEKIEPGISKNL